MEKAHCYRSCLKESSPVMEKKTILAEFQKWLEIGFYLQTENLCPVPVSVSAVEVSSSDVEVWKHLET